MEILSFFGQCHAKLPFSAGFHRKQQEFVSQTHFVTKTFPLPDGSCNFSTDTHFSKKNCSTNSFFLFQHLHTRNTLGATTMLSCAFYRIAEVRLFAGKC